MPPKPCIGITAGPMIESLPYGEIERVRVSAAYGNAVLAAGGLPIILPPQEGNTHALLDRVDGLLLTGGADIDPSRFGESEIHPETYEINSLRDTFELSSTQQAIERDLPVLAICRGIQVLNVALGGTLYQHIADQVANAIEHRQQRSGVLAFDPHHEIAIEPASLGHRIFGVSELRTNSLHHQAIRDLAPGLAINARSEDGIVEAVSHPGQAFVFGMQWHPELMFECHSEQLRPFTAFVEAAAKVPASVSIPA